jgi:hypothetical protein
MSRARVAEPGFYALSSSYVRYRPTPRRSCRTPGWIAKCDVPATLKFEILPGAMVKSSSSGHVRMKAPPFGGLTNVSMPCYLWCLRESRYTCRLEVVTQLMFNRRKTTSIDSVRRWREVVR